MDRISRIYKIQAAKVAKVIHLVNPANPASFVFRRNIPPEKIALSVSIGIAIGLFPVIGPTTFLCIFIAWALRINIALLQSVNYLMYPVQIICMIPIFKLGAFLFGREEFSFSVSEMIRMFKDNFSEALASLGWSVLYAIGAWLLMAPVIGIISYYSLLPVLKKIRKRKESKNNKMNSP